RLANVLDHRELLARRLRSLHALVSEKAPHERIELLAVALVREKLGQRLQSELGLVADDDLLLAADSPPLVVGHRGQELAALVHELLLDPQSRQEERLALACK